jgi:signal transduction histidine kinase
MTIFQFRPEKANNLLLERFFPNCDFHTLQPIRIMSAPATIQELRTVVALSDLPDEHLQWILDRSELFDGEDGELLSKTGDPADHLWMILEGKFSFYMNVNGTLVYYLTFENDRATGGITGLIPHSRMKITPGNSYAVGHIRSLRLHRQYFAELETLNPEFIQRLIGYMTERARIFATIQLQQEKMSALGKLSAGIAHELNNPAAAINRISAELNVRLQKNYDLTSKLLADKVDSAHLETIRALAIEKGSAQVVKRSALEKIEAEDDITDWFEDNGYPDERQAAETFAEFGFLIADFNSIRAKIGGDCFIDLLHWLENILLSARLIKDLDDASSRISHLVGAIKSHVHMDRTNDAQRTNIHTDLTNTITLLGYKLREKGITVTEQFADAMPPIDAYIGELNQVWTNLLDNAIDALDKNGEIRIETSAGQKDVTIRIIDNGTGIPKEIQSRIFDPFFTTKKVGQGTGIGLDIVKRIIDRHHGEIKVNSVPGRTEFSICLPISQTPAS